MADILSQEEIDYLLSPTEETNIYVKIGSNPPEYVEILNSEFISMKEYMNDSPTYSKYITHNIRVLLFREYPYRIEDIFSKDAKIMPDDDFCKIYKALSTQEFKNLGDV